MPIYEYRCQQCGEILEVRQRMDDPPLEQCGDRCRTEDPALRGAGHLDKVMSVSNIGRSSAAPPPMPASCGNCPGAGSCALEQ